MPIIYVPGGGGGTSDLTVQDLLNLDFLRVDANGFIIDGAGANISGSPSVADMPALLLLDPAVYARYAINIASGMNNAYFASNGSAFGPLNGQYIHERTTIPDIKLTSVNAGLTWTASDSGVPLTAGGGNRTRITTAAAAAHGMSTTGLYIQNTAAVTGWTALSNHLISTIVSASVLDLETAYTGGMGVPVFVAEGSEILAKEFTVPVLRNNSAYIAEVRCSYSAGATGHALISKLGGVTLTSQNLASGNLYNPHQIGFINQNSVNSQVSLGGSNSTGYVGNSLDITTGLTSDTSLGTVKFGLYYNLVTQNEWMRINNSTIIIRG